MVATKLMFGNQKSETRGAADCEQYREAARAFAVKLIVHQHALDHIEQIDDCICKLGEPAVGGR